MDVHGGEFFGTAATVVALAGVCSLLRALIRHRTLLHQARELSVRTSERNRSLARMAREHRSVVIEEHDGDGQRTITIRSAPAGPVRAAE